MNWLIRLILNIFTVEVKEPPKDRMYKPPNLMVTRYTAGTPTELGYTEGPEYGDERLYEASHWTEPISGIGVDPNSAWGQLRHRVFVRDKYTCQNCGSHSNLTVDHIIPSSLEGTNELTNLQTLCKNCHQLKHGGKKFLERQFSSQDDYGSRPRVSKKLHAILNAKKNKQDIQIKYRDYFGVRSIRTIRPLKIVRSGKHTYIKAFCRLDSDIRIFRLSRLSLPDSSSNEDIYLDEPVQSELPTDVADRFNNMFS